MTGVTLAEARAQIIAAGRWLDGKGWAPATAGNYSMRLADGTVAITVSGRHKGRLVEEDVMVVGLDGVPREDKRPSAETALHCQLYRVFDHVGAVLHSHSPVAVGFTRAHPEAGAWDFAGHEMLKVFPGVTTHETNLRIPIVDNSQDMDAVQAAIAPALMDAAPPPAYLIRSHGLYGWGRNMAEAERVIEATEWLIAAELAERAFRMGGGR